MNDLRNRLDHLAAEATDHVVLRHPRSAPARHPLRGWFAAAIAALAVGTGALAGGNLVLNTGDGGTDVRTVESSTPTPTSTPTTVPPAPEVDDDTAVDPDDDTAGVSEDDGPVAPAPSSPVTSDPGPGGPDDDPVSAVMTRYGELGPDTAVPPNDRTSGTAGSGCTPGDGDRLPDGVWMGEVSDLGADEIAIDLVCFTTVSSSNGEELFEDFVITNESSKIRRMPVAPDVRFFLQTAPPVSSVTQPTETRPFTDAAEAARFALRSGDASPLAWVLIEGGRVTEIYSPPLQSA